VWVDWCDAYAFCSWAGKHLCGAIQGGSSSEANAANPQVDEWYVACSTDGANVYPYGGNTYVEGKCNDSEAKAGLRAVATFPGCVGGYSGIFDMNGNVYEWEDACAVAVGASDSCVIRGGAFDFSGTGYGGCNTYFNDYTVERSDTYDDTGFRCCDD
jgi:formylglycine-generating enzyme required for sulfatase activity